MKIKIQYSIQRIDDEETNKKLIQLNDKREFSNLIFSILSTHQYNAFVFSDCHEFKLLKAGEKILREKIESCG